MQSSFQEESFTRRLIAGEGGYGTLRLVAIVLLLAGTAWSGYLFKQYVDHAVETPLVAPAMQDLASKDQERLDSLVQRFSDTKTVRMRGVMVANSIVNGNREPFVRTYSKAMLEAQAQPAAAGAETMEQPVIPAYIPEKMPPIMFVRAVMVVEKTAMAIMDIEGVGTGIIVRKGYTFNGGEGRVLHIGPDKVTVQWSGKKMEIAPGL